MGKVLRDAVHGDIELTPEELALLDTPAMQRLRGVKQLGTAHLVYPCAVHTRFEHSLGTLHLAGRIAERLGDALSPEERRAARIAGLLHDVTHIPFGHTFEDERALFPRHDVPERTLRFLRTGALAAALDRTGLRDLVEAALTARAEGGLVGDIVAGTIGADLLDYLRRDGLFCGLEAGYDPRVFRYMTAARTAEGRPCVALAVKKQGMMREDALSEVVRLLSLRYTLCERVYFHHAKVATGAAISKAVELCVDGGLTLEELFPLSDDGLLDLVVRRMGEGSPAAALVGAVRRREVPKRAYVLTREIGEPAQLALVRRFRHDRAERSRFEAQLAAAAGLDPHEVILHCPGPRMALKEADVPLLLARDAPTQTLASLGLPEVDVIIEKHRGLWRFCVLVPRARSDRAERVQAAAEAALGHPSALRARPA